MRVYKMLTGLFLTLLIISTAAVILGGPKTPKSLDSINNPFKSVDFSDLPALQTYVAKDNVPLSFRAYNPANGKQGPSIVLVHGSSASSSSMHVMAKAFSAAGYTAFTLDMRGHGASDKKGTIAYIGQLEDDIESFVKTVQPPAPTTLAGFSSGGGFVLRFAGGNQQNLFDNYLLLSPFLGPNAPNYRPNAGGWASVGIPRIIVLSALNRVGITALNDLTVTKFALDEKAKSVLTPSYSFALASNFQPNSDYNADIAAMQRPCAVLAGSADEAFIADTLDGIFSRAANKCKVELVPDIGHIALTLDAKALDAAIRIVADTQPLTQ